MGNHNILSKVDRALVAWIISRNAGTKDNVWPAKRSLDKTSGGTTCWSHSFATLMEGPYCGSVMVEAFVEVRSPGVIEATQGQDDPRIASDKMVSDVSDCFALNGAESGEPLGQAITDAARATADSDMQDLTLISVKVVGGNQGFNPRMIIQQGNMWVDPLHLEIICCPSNVS